MILSMQMIRKGVVSMKQNKKLLNKISEFENRRHQKEENQKLEYATLQNKISEIESRHHNVLIFTFSAIGVISYFSIQQEKPIIMFANYFIIVISMYILEKLYQDKNVISDHIRTNHEKEIIGLKFETDRAKASSKDQMREHHVFTKFGSIILFICYFAYDWNSILQYANFIALMMIGTLIIRVLARIQRETDKNQ